MALSDVKKYLCDFRGRDLLPEIPEILSKLKKIEIDNNNEEAAKQIWCVEQVYHVINLYLSGYKYLEQKKHFDAWQELDRADIGLSLLRKHLDYNDNIYNLLFVEKTIYQLQKLFPYRHFTSREAVIKKRVCSVCGSEITLRNSCGHKPGEIYNGESCYRIIKDIDLLAISIVTNPFDKYTVLFPQDLEYNYGMLEQLMEHWKSPFEKWELHIVRETKEEYKSVSRNDRCPCGSGKKYKKCCLLSENDKFDHYRMLFSGKPTSFNTPITMVGTWK